MNHVRASSCTKVNPYLSFKSLQVRSFFSTMYHYDSGYRSLIAGHQAEFGLVFPPCVVVAKRQPSFRVGKAQEGPAGTTPDGIRLPFWVSMHIPRHDRDCDSAAQAQCESLKASQSATNLGYWILLPSANDYANRQFVSECAGWYWQKECLMRRPTPRGLMDRLDE